jgi:hypothetical protein
MTVSLPIPAAQYLPMSTEHQQYSTENRAPPSKCCLPL